MEDADQLLAEYQACSFAEDRGDIVRRLLVLARSSSTAIEALLYVLNDENDSEIRRSIVQFLKSTRPKQAVHVLTKEMFDPDPIIRAHAPIAVADYDDVHLLGWSLGALLDAVPDPATRPAAERAIRTISGKSSEKINASERERLRQGEHPETIWPDHFANLPRKNRPA